MTEMFDIPEISTKAQRIRQGLLKLRSVIATVFLAHPSRSTDLDDDANQIELRQLAHQHREVIRRATDELLLLGVRN